MTKRQQKYRINQASNIIGVHKDTLRKYEVLGWVKPIRDRYSHRLYTIEMLEDLCEEAKKHTHLIDKLPEVNSKPFTCLRCSRQLNKGECDLCVVSSEVINNKNVAKK